jgi:multicomponent Na+:H+ antiporter subunit F
VIDEVVFYAGAIWMTVLLGASVLLVIRARTVPGRILALDMLVLILVALLILYADSQRTAAYLDAGLALALLSFAATVAAARYHGEGRVF